MSEGIVLQGQDDAAEIELEAVVTLRCGDRTVSARHRASTTGDLRDPEAVSDLAFAVDGMMDLAEDTESLRRRLAPEEPGEPEEPEEPEESEESEELVEPEEPVEPEENQE